MVKSTDIINLIEKFAVDPAKLEALSLFVHRGYYSDYEEDFDTRYPNLSKNAIFGKIKEDFDKFGIERTYPEYEKLEDNDRELGEFFDEYIKENYSQILINIVKERYGKLAEDEKKIVVFFAKYFDKISVSDASLTKSEEIKALEASFGIDGEEALDILCKVGILNRASSSSKKHFYSSGYVPKYLDAFIRELESKEIDFGFPDPKDILEKIDEAEYGTPLLAYIQATLTNSYYRDHLKKIYPDFSGGAIKGFCSDLAEALNPELRHQIYEHFIELKISKSKPLIDLFNFVLAKMKGKDAFATGTSFFDSESLTYKGRASALGEACFFLFMPWISTDLWNLDYEYKRMSGIFIINDSQRIYFRDYLLDKEWEYGKNKCFLFFENDTAYLIPPVESSKLINEFISTLKNTEYKVVEPKEIPKVTEEGVEERMKQGYSNTATSRIERYCSAVISSRCTTEIIPQANEYFVAHAFSKDKIDDLRSAITEAFKEHDLRPYYADQEVKSGHILCKICEKIRASRFGIFEISDRNPNVMLELGMAYGFGKPALLIVRKGCEIPADLQGLDRVEYGSFKDLTKELRIKTKKFISK